MADNNIDIDEFQRSLEELSRSMTNAASSTAGLSESERRAKNDLEQYTDSLKKAKEEQYAYTKRMTDGAVQFGKSVSQGAGSFAPLNAIIDLTTKTLGGLMSAIPVVGGALKALGEGAGEVAKLMIDQFQTGLKAYKDLADTGLANSFEDMSKTAKSTGLLFQDVNSALSKYTTDVANFGGSMSKGMKTFRETSESLKGTREEFRALGIGAQEFTEYQAKYMAQETRMGNARNQNLAKGTQEYIEQLDTLSKLTGLSRKDLQAQRDAALSETKFGAAVSEMTKQTRESFMNLNTYISAKGGPNLAQGLRDLTSGAVTSDAAKQLMLQTGGKASEVVDKMRSGALTAEQGFDELRKSMDPKAMAEYAKYTGDSALAAKNFSEVQKMSNSEAPTKADIAEIEKNRKDNITGVNAQTKAVTAAEGKMYDASRQIQDMSTSSEAAAKSIDLMATAVKGATDMLQKVIGSPSGDGQKKSGGYGTAPGAGGAMGATKSVAKEAQQGAVKAQSRSYASTNMTPVEAQNALDSKDQRLIKDSGGQKMLEAIASGMSNKEANEKYGNKEKSIDDILSFAGGIAGNRRNFDDLDSSLKEKVIAAATEYNQMTGGKGKLLINSAARSQDDQAKIKGQRGNLAAEPGTSKHERGMAVDIQNYGDDAAMSALQKNGLKNTVVKGEPWHFEQARTGGIFKGPSTGYNVELHGEEIVTPANEGVSKQALGTSTAFGQESQMMDGMFARLDQMIEKYDTIIELLDDGNDHSKKLVNAMA